METIIHVMIKLVLVIYVMSLVACSIQCWYLIVLVPFFAIPAIIFASYT